MAPFFVDPETIGLLLDEPYVSFVDVKPDEWFERMEFLKD